MMSTQRISEETGVKDPVPIECMNESVAKEAGLPPPPPPARLVDIEKKNRKKRKQERKRDQHNPESNKKASEHSPVIDLHISNSEVKRTTGFASFFMLLAFVLIVCNGSFEYLGESVSCLTWLEEWFAYFEWTWGRTHTRWVDLESRYKVSERTLKRIILKKRGIVLKARQKWPFFVSFEEDLALRDPRWNERYSGKRVTFWDDTNIDMPHPGDASLNRRTFSSYYGGNVGKGAVFVQLCGWLGTWSLWTGAVSDTYYLCNSGILDLQEKFAKQDLVGLSAVLGFTNILDKGYRCSVAVWRRGQYVLQPWFAKSDQQFSTDQVLSSAAIATDRGGNERAVNVCKRAGLLQRGLAQNGSTAELDDAWLAWSFQANFMFKPVL